MKKKLIFFMAVLSLSTGFCACSSDEEPAEAPIPQGVNNRLKVLNGTFHSETFSESTNTLDCEDVTFTPYRQHKQVFGALTGNVTVWGEAVFKKYYNDHLLETTKNCYFSFSEGMPSEIEGVNFEILFYGRAENGNTSTGESKRLMQITSQTSFLMTPYWGTAELFKTYTKQ